MKVKYPHRAAIDPTGGCNYNCKYCQYRNSGIRDMELSLDEIISIFDDMEKLTMNNVHISGGGEPLYHPSFKEIIEEINKRKFPYSVITTGYLIDEDIIDIFAESPNWLIEGKGPSYIGVSVWGPDKESYSNLQGVPESYFGEVINNIDRIKERDIEVRGCTTIVPENYDKMYDLIELFSEHEVDRVYLRKGFTKKYNKILNGKQIKEVEDQIEDAKDDFNMLIGPSGKDIDGYEFDYSGKENIKYCRYVLNTINISCDGKVYPCCGLRYEDYAVIGDIREKSFYDIMNDDFHDFLKNFKCKSHFCTLPPLDSSKKKNKELEEELENDRS